MSPVYHLEKSPLLREVRGRLKVERNLSDTLVASNIETERLLNTVALSRS